MAKKDKEHAKLHKIYKSGEKYHCGECGAEVHWANDCPGCKAKIDWSQIEGITHRVS